MSEDDIEITVKEPSGHGCMMIIGIVSVSIAIGHMWGSAVGWLVFGLICIGIVATDCAFRTFAAARK